MKLNITNEEIYFDAEKVLEFLGFLNMKFANLQSLTLDYIDFTDLVYDRSQDGFPLSPDYFKNMVSYKDKLAVYNGRIAVELNHCIECEISLASRRHFNNFLEKLKSKLREYKFSSWIREGTTFYEFKKSSKAAENFELKIQIKITFYS